MHLLYPSDPLRTKRPDDTYAEEFSAVRSAGFSASVFSLEEFAVGRFAAFPPLPVGPILYRGWMLPPARYDALITAFTQSKATPFTDTAAYRSAHYLPGWYPALAALTPETRFYPPTADLAAELRALDWPAYFIKDFVKSLKTSVGSIISDPQQASTVAGEMQRFRGTIEGGFCVRRVEDFLPETERRYFVINGEAFSADGSIPELVNVCAARLPSRFFSVDVIQRRDGVLRIVEIGDGQVSDLVGWTPEQFASMLQRAFPSSRPSER